MAGKRATKKPTAAAKAKKSENTKKATSSGPPAEPQPVKIQSENTKAEESVPSGNPKTPSQDLKQSPNPGADSASSARSSSQDTGADNLDEVCFPICQPTQGFMHSCMQRSCIEFPPEMLTDNYGPSEAMIQDGLPLLVGSQTFESTDLIKWSTLITPSNWDQNCVRWMSVFVQHEGSVKIISVSKWVQVEFRITDKNKKLRFSQKSEFAPIQPTPMGFTRFLPFVEVVKLFDDGKLYLETHLTIMESKNHPVIAATQTSQNTDPQAPASSEPIQIIKASASVAADEMKQSTPEPVFNPNNTTDLTSEGVAVTTVDTTKLENESLRFKSVGNISPSYEVQGSRNLVENYGWFIETGNCPILTESSVEDQLQLLELALVEMSHTLITACLSQLPFNIGGEKLEYAARFLDAITKTDIGDDLIVIKEWLRTHYKEIIKQDAVRSLLSDKSKASVILDIVFSPASTNDLHLVN